MNSRSLARLRESTLVEIDEIWNCDDVVAIRDSEFALSLFQSRSHRIAPSELRCESVPDKEVAIVQAAALFETPFQNFLVRPALLHTLNQIAMMHAQKIAAHTVGRFERAEVFLIIFVELAAQMLPNLVQHAREIQHTFGHFFRAFWIGPHAKSNRRCALYAQLGQSLCKYPSLACAAHQRENPRFFSTVVEGMKTPDFIEPTNGIEGVEKTRVVCG